MGFVMLLPPIRQYLIRVMTAFSSEPGGPAAQFIVPTIATITTDQITRPMMMLSAHRIENLRTMNLAIEPCRIAP